jgi:hypothetical protein
VTGPQGERGHRGATGATGPSGRGCCKVGELAFTPFDMTTCEEPLAPFVKIYDVQPKVAIRGWTMKPSNETQYPISLYFEVPKDFDCQGKTELDLHILVPRSEGVLVNGPQRQDNKVRIRVRSDFKGNSKTLGCWFEDCVTECIAVEEPVQKPDCKPMKHYRVTVPLKSKHIEPQDLGVLAFDRDSCPGNDEFGRNVYLVGASFRYTIKCKDR